MPSIPVTYFQLKHVQDYLLKKYITETSSAEAKKIVSIAISLITLNERNILRKLQHSPNDCASLILSLITKDEEDFKKIMLSYKSKKMMMTDKEQQKIIDDILTSAITLRSLNHETNRDIEVSLSTITNKFERLLILHTISEACFESLTSAYDYLHQQFPKSDNDVSRSHSRINV